MPVRRIRHAVTVDPSKKKETLRRLRRIEGQIRGLQRMVEDERYCGDILTQIASVQEALAGAGRLLTRNHLEHCITDAIRSRDPRAAAGAYDELIDLIYRYTRA